MKSLRSLNYREMINARFRFAGELNDFLTKRLRGNEFSYQFEPHQSIKHLIEALGVPHPEVGEIRVNGKPVDFKFRVKDGDFVHVFPDGSKSGDQPQEMRFVLDNHLGKLAAYLRMLGYDTLYRNDYQDETLAQIPSEQNRILLTRDRRLLMRNEVRYGYCLRSLDPLTQLKEIVKRYRLNGSSGTFQRCLRCNTPLDNIEKEAILDRLEPLTKQYYDDFRICLNCNQIYWRGSHYERMARMIKEVLESPSTSCE